MKNIEIANRKINIIGTRDAEMVLLWPVMVKYCPDIQKCYEMICNMTKGICFSLVQILVDEWEDDLSPWMYKDEKMSFAGNARTLLEWIENEFINEYLCYANKSREELTFQIGGYSLAGLFSLWAAYESDLFYGVASCSGSLWYPGFAFSEEKEETYLSKNDVPKTKQVYFSLGDKEAKTRNFLMSRVEEATKMTYDKCVKNEKIERVIYQKNSGNHFKQTIERTVKGFGWLLENSDI